MDIVEILKGLKLYFEEFYKIKYIDDVIEIVVELLFKYMYDCKLLDKVIDVIDEVGVF